MDTASCGLKTIEDSDIAKLHSIYLSFLKDLDPFLTQNNLSYALGGGSMLGAIRHKGFIPWDDDLDITMTREDFDKFAKIADTFMPDKYYLRKPGDKGYLFQWPKIFIKNTAFEELLSSEDSPRELFVDIFIVEDVPDKNISRKIRGYRSSLYLLACSAVRVRKCKPKMSKYTGNAPEVNKEINKRAFAGFFFSFRSIEKWCKAADEFFAGYRDDTSKDIVIPSGALHFWGEIYPREILTLTRRVPFEDIEVNVPLYAEKYLAQRYGKDYMQIPPKHARAKHALISFDTGDKDV